MAHIIGACQKTRQSLKKLGNKASDIINEQNHVTNSQGFAADRAQKGPEIIRTTSSKGSKKNLQHINS